MCGLYKHTSYDMGQPFCKIHKKTSLSVLGGKEFPKNDPNFAPSAPCKAPPSKAMECVWIDLKFRRTEKLPVSGV